MTVLRAALGRGVRCAAALLRALAVTSVALATACTVVTSDGKGPAPVEPSPTAPNEGPSAIQTHTSGSRTTDGVPPRTGDAAASVQPGSTGDASRLDVACTRALGECGHARCDEAARRCYFPCRSDRDCVEGARCSPAPGAAAITTCQAPLPPGFAR